MHTLNCSGKILSLQTPLLMGILNLTPDSISDGGKFNSLDNALRQAEKMLREGADIIDVGGYSTRPNASDVSLQEETSRVVPVIEAIRKNFPNSIISIDTFRAVVAQKAIEVGASIVNDISGGQLDEKMFETAAQMRVPYILMHSRGNPQTMSQLCNYENIFLEILHFFEQRIEKLTILGVKDVILDLGFGFAKTREQNFQLLKHLSFFENLKKPILIGISRKSMIYKTLHIEPSQALNGTTALHMFALEQGAKILRVHDVAAAKETLTLWQKLQKS
ncbi:MAG: dihydropteroate synthase [Raineya sp.]